MKNNYLLISFTVVHLFSCSHIISSEHRQNKATQPEQSPIAPIASTTLTNTGSQTGTTQIETMQINIVSSPVTVDKKDQHQHHHEDATTPEVALRYLRNGNIRFVKGYLRNDGASTKDIKRLVSGQHPHTIVVSCSDSRVPPEIIFDEKLGEIFVVRTAGETLDPTTLGSIEYALEHLGTKNIVVLGHTNCGAVKAAFSTLNGQDAGSDNLNKLVQDIHPRIQQFKDKTPSHDYYDEGLANASGVANDLIKRSRIIAEKVEHSGVKITPAIYDLDTGKVTFKSP